MTAQDCTRTRNDVPTGAAGADQTGACTACREAHYEREYEPRGPLAVDASIVGGRR